MRINEEQGCRVQRAQGGFLFLNKNLIRHIERNGGADAT